MAVSKASPRIASVFTQPAGVAEDVGGVVARPALATLVAMALASAAGLLWEITLTRLASVILSYHYAFVAVSLAIGGLGLGAAVVYALPSHLGRRMAAPGMQATSVAFLLVAVLTPVVAAQGALISLILLALLPFLTLGVAVAALFRTYAATSGWLYGADLVGAGFGAALSVPALDLGGPFGTLFVLAVGAALAGLLLVGHPSSSFAEPDLAGGGREQRDPTPHSGSRAGYILAPVLVAIALLALVVQVARAPLGIDYAALHNAPPDKTIVQVLHNPALGAHVVSTRWDAFARTDVVATAADPSQRDVFVDGGAGTFMVQWNGDIHTQASHLNDLETLPLLLGPRANVLVVGAGGGIDVVRALVAGAHHVTAVELNQATVDAVRAAGAYNGNILDRPGVTTIVDDGRHYLAQTHQKYDTILLNLVYSGAAEGTSHALAESYIFTTEAFQSYLAHLTPNGRIGIISHQGLEGSRAFFTGLEALHRDGLSYRDALAHSTLLMTNNSTPETRPTLTIISKSPLTGSQVRTLRTRANQGLNLQPIWVPFFFTGAFTQMEQGTLSLAQFLQGEDYNVGPTDDNQPFFFDLNPGLPDGLAAALWWAGFLIAAIISVVFFLREGPDEKEARRNGADVRLRGGIWMLGLFFALLGVGFMCVEVPLIQRFILILGEPVLALTVILATLLIAGGLGSMLGMRLFARLGALPIAPLLVALIILIAAVVLPALQSFLLDLGSGGSVVGSILVLIPLGFALGLPFPLGLRLATRVLPGDVALFWSLNALFSVFGSIIAAVIAVQVGFGMVLAAGAICYVLAAGIMRLMVTSARPLA